MNEPKCLNSLEGTFGNDNNDLVRRTLNLSSFKPSSAVGLARIFSLIVAYLIVKLEDSAAMNFHFPSSALSQISSASSASSAVFKTADNDPSPVSVTMTATESDSPSATSGGPLSTVTADADGHSKGDIEIKAPSNEVANALNEFFKEGDCPAPNSKRGVAMEKRVDDNIEDCLLDGFTNILNAMGINGDLHGLAETAMQVVQNFPLPTFQDQQYAAAFGQALVNGADAVPRYLNGIAQNRIVLTTTFVFLLSTANVQHKLMEESKMVLAQEQLLTFEEEFKPACPEKGDKYYPKCDLFICQGKDGVCTVPPMKPCSCDEGNSNCPGDYDQVIHALDIHIACPLDCNADSVIAGLFKMRWKQPQMHIWRPQRL